MTTAIYQSVKGFTLVELLITIAIVGILAAIAIPSYLSYVDKSRMTEVIQAAEAFKTAVSECTQRIRTLTGCNNSANGIPPARGAIGNVASVTVANGVITATAQNLSQAYTYILTPTRDATTGILTWTVGGTCLAGGAC